MKRIIAVLFCLATICLANVRGQSFNQLASDNFVRANQNPLSGNWSRALGITADAQIVSNMVEVSSGPANTATDYYNAVSWPNDQYSEIVAQADSASSTGNVMAAVRMSTTDNTMYYGGAANSSFGPSATFEIKKRLPGNNPVVLGSPVTHAYAAGDIIRLAAQGTTLTLYLNGTAIVTATDSSITNGRAGFMIQTDANLADVRFNNWAGGSITGSGGPRVYITQTGSPSGNCTSGVQSAAWFNTPANWGTSSGQIGPGTTVLICGVITTSLQWQGSGTSGNPITMLFDTGAKLSQPYCGQGGGTSCMTLNGNSWWVIDGGIPCGATAGGLPSGVACNGKVGTTANGTGLANQNGDNPGIDAGGTSNGEIRNLEVGPIYVRTSITDQHPDSNNNEKPYAIDLSGGSYTGSTNILIHDGKAHDANWSITMLSEFVGNGPVTIYNEDIYNDNHGIAVGVASNTSSGIVAHDNHFGDMVNWDDCTQAQVNGGTCVSNFHHDPIHFYSAVCNTCTPGSIGATVYNNFLDGNMGITNTAHIFYEGPISGNIFNNVFIVQSGISLSNGSFNNCNSVGSGTNVKNIGYYNNTLIYLTTGTGTPIELCGTVDVRNNALTLAQTNNPGLVGYSGTGTIDFNAYANPAPTAPLFSPTSTCCQWTYSVWQGAGHLNDTHSIAIQAPTMGLNTSTGVPAANSPVVIGGPGGTAPGTNLTSLAIAALNADKAGNPRPASGGWTIGAYNSGSGGGPDVSLSPTNLNFGNVVVGNPSTTQTVTLTNTGTATLDISSITFTGTNPGDFSKTTTCGATVAAQGTCTVTVTFTPTAAGARSASLSFTDDAVSSPQTVTLSGTGTTISLVHFSACPTQSWTGNCTISSTSAGHSLVVGFTSNNGQGGALITAVTDNAGDSCTQVPGARSTNTTPNSSADIWTCFGGKGGATSITVTTNATATGELGVWEVANVQSVDAKCAGNSQAASATPSGCGLTTTSPSEFLVELADYQGSITGMNTGNAFVSDSTQQGNGFAHLIVSSRGTYNAQWASSVAGTYNTSGVSLH